MIQYCVTICVFLSVSFVSCVLLCSTQSIEAQQCLFLQACWCRLLSKWYVLESWQAVCARQKTTHNMNCHCYSVWAADPGGLLLYVSLNTEHWWSPLLNCFSPWLACLYQLLLLGDYLSKLCLSLETCSHHFPDTNKQKVCSLRQLVVFSPSSEVVSFISTQRLREKIAYLLWGCSDLRYFVLNYYCILDGKYRITEWPG